MGLEYCTNHSHHRFTAQVHFHGIIHRDIKPQNLLEDTDSTIKIGDFGVSVICSSTERMKSTEGTYYFMAPEELDGEADLLGSEGKLADIWALGVSLYAFLHLRLPFFSPNLFETISAIKT